MGKIFYIMGKSASGKDTVYHHLCDDKSLGLRTVTLYTTRPRREGETDGVEYHFIDDEGVEKLGQQGLIIELRAYHTVHGIWKYLTADDGQICPGEQDYLMIGTLESYKKMREYFGKEFLVPIYIETEDGERLIRAVKREQKEPRPRYAELCRRFLADSEDFSEEKLKECGITLKFENRELEDCIQKVKLFISNIINT